MAKRDTVPHVDTQPTALPHAAELVDSPSAIQAHPMRTNGNALPPPPMASYAKIDAGENGEDNSEFVKIETERFMYNAQKCWADQPKGKRRALVGYLINVIDMPPIEMGGQLRQWQALVIKTTRETLAVDRDKNVVEVPEGSEVLIPGTHQLLQFLSRAAQHPQACFKMFIEPKQKIELGKGQTMWTYTLGSNPKPISRSELGITGMLTYNTPPQLPGAAGADGIPF